MQTKNTWQRLIALESRDVVSSWFKRLHGRDPSEKKAKEVVASARQARGYYENALTADYSVRALLEYYGTMSLANAITLLMLRDGGDAALKRGHGLKAIEWPEQMTSNIGTALRMIEKLSVDTCEGSFLNFVGATGNTSSLHVSSSAVDMRQNHEIIPPKTRYQLGEILARTPDLAYERAIIGANVKCTGCESECDEDSKPITIRLWENHPNIIKSYRDLGFTSSDFEVSKKENSKHDFYLANAYMNPSSIIPQIYVVEHYEHGWNLSQLASTYVVSYFCGMLVRYYPTQWVALMNGEKGDGVWPQLYKVHAMTQELFPMLIMNFLEEKLRESQNYVC